MRIQFYTRRENAGYSLVFARVSPTDLAKGAGELLHQRRDRASSWTVHLASGQHVVAGFETVGRGALPLSMGHVVHRCG